MKEECSDAIHVSVPLRMAENILVLARTGMDSELAFNKVYSDALREFTILVHNQIAIKYSQVITGTKDEDPFFMWLDAMMRNTENEDSSVRDSNSDDAGSS